MNQSQIKVGLATEEQVNQEFIDAWHRAEQGTLTTTEERLYFLDTKTFLEVLSQGRLMLLYTLRTQGTLSVRTLSQLLARKYKNVYQDVQLLKKAGLIQETTVENVFVPWDKIQAEIDLSAMPVEQSSV